MFSIKILLLIFFICTTTVITTLMYDNNNNNNYMRSQNPNKQQFEPSTKEQNINCYGNGLIHGFEYEATIIVNGTGYTSNVNKDICDYIFNKVFTINLPKNIIFNSPNFECGDGSIYILENINTDIDIKIEGFNYSLESNEDLCEYIYNDILSLRFKNTNSFLYNKIYILKKYHNSFLLIIVIVFCIKKIKNSKII